MAEEKREAALHKYFDPGPDRFPITAKETDAFRAGYNAALADNAERVLLNADRAGYQHLPDLGLQTSVECKRSIMAWTKNNSNSRLRASQFHRLLSDHAVLVDALAEARATIERVREAAERYKTAPVRYKHEAADQAFECVNTVIAILWPVKP